MLADASRAVFGSNPEPSNIGAKHGTVATRPPVDEVIAELGDKRRNDVRWEDGRAFGMVYNGGPAVHAVAEQAARLYLHENALNTAAFPSLGAIQADVVGWTAAAARTGTPPPDS